MHPTLGMVMIRQHRLSLCSALQSAVNAKSLQMVETALFCMSFDRGRPDSKEESARLSHGGEGRNKWFDKSLTSVIFENGRVGLNAEHTPVDAMTVVALFVKAIDDIRTWLQTQRQQIFEAPPPRTSAVPPVQLLHWELKPETKLSIERASSESRGVR